jgi:hypothetical protein
LQRTYTGTPKAQGERQFVDVMDGQNGLKM